MTYKEKVRGMGGQRECSVCRRPGVITLTQHDLSRTGSEKCQVCLHFPPTMGNDKKFFCCCCFFLREHFHYTSLKNGSTVANRLK